MNKHFDYGVGQLEFVNKICDFVVHKVLISELATFSSWNLSVNTKTKYFVSELANS